MRYNIYRWMVLLWVLIHSTLTFAYDVIVDGIYYNLDTSAKTAEVTYRTRDHGSYSGNVVIPTSISHNGTAYSVTSIGGWTSVKIPFGVTSFGSGAFMNCSELTSVTIPTSVTSIGYSAFYGCSGLSSVTIPNSVTSIDQFAFSGCSSLTTITIPNSVTSIDQSAFSGCSSLTTITIPNSVTSIGSFAFANCSNLTSINVESGNTMYDSRGNCNAIIETETNTLIIGCKTTVIPNSVTNIGYGAFYGCSGLTSVTIPTSVTSIGYSAFYGCSELSSVTIPNSVTSIGNDTFRGCSGLTSINVESDNNMYDSRGNCNAIIETSTNTLITGCKNTIIPNSVTSIGNDAFRGCSGLSSVTIPNSVKNIGFNAFNGCSSLTSINIPNSVTSIDNGAFSECRGLFSIDVESDNTAYDSRENCNAIIETSTNTLITGCKNTIIPNSVTSIGGYAFYGCSSLTTVTIPNSVIAIGYHAFQLCSGLTSVTIPNSVTSIDEVAFCGCSNLTTITIPNSVTSIGRSVFYGCGLTSVTIPNSVTSIGNSAFERCSGLSSVSIPNSVKSIGSFAFSGCSNLTSVTIPNGVTNIDAGTFEGCTSLTAVTIPQNVKSIYGYAFQGCSKMNYVNSKIEAPFNISTDVFQEISSDATLEIPKGTRSNYEAVSGWTDNFKSIIEDENSGTTTYKFSITATGNGSVTYNSTSVRSKTQSFIVDEGTDAMITFTPDNGYRIASVKVNNRDVTSSISNNQYTISNIKANTTVAVVFEEPVTELTADGINYSIVSQPEKTIKVAGVSNGQVLTVPSTVTQNGKTWTVTGIDNNALKDNKQLAAVIWNPEAAFTATVSNPNLLLYVKQEQYAPAAIKNVVVNGTASNITLTEAQSGNDFYCPQAFTARSISYTHRYGMQTGIGESRGWETIALPFDVQRISHETKGDITPFTLWKSSDSSKPFWLYELTGSGFTEADGIKAYTPYIISMPNNPKYDSQWLLNGNVTFSASNVTVGKTENVKTATYRDRTFVPNYADKGEAEKLYALNVSNDYTTNESGMTEGSKFVLNMRQVHPFEAYMTTTSNARQVIDVCEDMTTDIKTLGIWEQCSGSDSLYDLQGRKVSHATKGVYVNQKGQKRIIK